ncbi:cupin domain-containing protein [Pseudonocardia sp. 73-21]|uniref:cupin domain-containing protein n=1 Tax=Pseudonocardia sp. 73-21 TaxID=1895809 RepID=UPI00096228EE|nr:cupin domain-containing protein [Pseudonocardia sp. 73-21]OJY42635.1 MAG: cupin [Pseudonocardia sp. 73-21]
MDADQAGRPPVHLAPGEGRRYDMGPITAVFKADGAETVDRYSISEWWMEPHTTGPGAHTHPEDDVFYVLEGTMTFLVGDRWIDAPEGSFVLAPGGTPHDFQNRTDERAGALNVHTPGAFEPRMPGIVEWFLENPPVGPGAAPSAAGGPPSP